MKVKELRAILDGVDGELDVIMSSDPEGNSFHDLEDVNTDTYIRRYRGSVEAIHDDDVEEGDQLKGVVLWP